MSTLHWFKSSYSDSSGGSCVEVAVRPHTAVHVRDSKVAPTGPAITFAPRTWAAFTSHLQAPEEASA
ncbi:DUF397 domain-containing protein [Streptomyces sp. A3M-1-3]|uniref:DUF397 domain-containing protein n=1 Tax=Streptomyces sp. A3M-1-3 TaxID=2962044 RepID=UPI0020B67843|nr:DUF397 domain-containing protein [Streptomyces sp. A3M-1-3]MCP3816866.1 DUF397 domain-containing protein [Streptomyces sp. A3M-1-3]